MKFKLGNVEVRIARANAKKKEGVISHNDLTSINDDHLDYINSLSADELQSRLDSVSVSDLESEENLTKASQLLKDEGIFLVPNFLDENTVADIQAANEKLKVKLKELESKKAGFYEDDELVVQSTDVRISRYSDLVNYGKPVVYVRQDDDLGMMDIFNYDQLPGISQLNLDKIAEKESLLKVASNRDTPLSLSNINIYFNKGNKSRGGFHYDDFNNNIKAFIYTLDAKLENGPYCYVKGTHTDGSYRLINKLVSKNYGLNDTEAPLLPVQNIIPAMGKSGTLVVSDQTGIHRGLPQGKDKERALLVIRYK